MTSQPATKDVIRAALADHDARTRSYVRDCILLAVVTSEEVAANLIDQAVALHVHLQPAAAPCA